MPTWIYSSESLPAAHLIGKPGYTPESMSYHGITLTVRAGEWQKLDEYYPVYHHKDWMDKNPRRERIYSDEMVKGMKGLYEKRGVIFLDHDPTPAEKESLPKVSEEINRQFRSDTVKNFEDQVREREITGHGRSKPTPFEDECYDILGMRKPYSPDALRDSRDPGAAAATKIATAIVDALARDRDAILKTKVATVPAK